MHVPYIFPQESGGRADVHWAAFLPSHPSSTPHLDNPATLPHITTPEYGLMALALHKGTSQHPPTPSIGSGSLAVETAAENSAGATAVQACTNAASVPPSFALVSALPHSVMELHRARHQFELQPDGNTHVLLDAFHMGVGGDDSWSPSVHKQFLLNPSVFQFGVAFTPVLCKSQDSKGLL